MEKLNPYSHLPAAIPTDKNIDLSKNLWFQPEQHFSLRKSSVLYEYRPGENYCIVDCSRCYIMQGEYGFLRDLIGTVAHTKHVEDSPIGIELKNIWKDINTSDVNEWNIKTGIYRFYEELVHLSFKVVFFIPNFQLIIDKIRDNELHVLNNVSVVNEYVKIWVISDSGFVRNGSLLRTNFCKSFATANDTHIGKINSIIIRNQGFQGSPESIQKTKNRMKKIKVFISYAHADENYKDDLKKHLSGLKRNGIINEWNDRYIIPGKKWDAEIKRNLEESQIVLFLISSDFMSSDYINDVEIARTIERYGKSEVVIVPIIIRACDFSSLSLSDFQALPIDAKAISSWNNEDEAWVDVIKGIKNVIANIANIKNAGTQFQKAEMQDKSIINQSGRNSINIGNNNGIINISK